MADCFRLFLSSSSIRIDNVTLAFFFFFFFDLTPQSITHWLSKSNDIKEFISSSIAKMMGISISIEIKAIDGTSERLVSENGFQDNINEVFDIKSMD